MRRRAIRRETCPTCGVEVGVTRGELRRRIVQCVCGARFALDVQGGDADPHRAMLRVSPRVLMAGPPTGRIEESLGPVPTLLIRQERGKRRAESVVLIPLGVGILVATAVFHSVVGLLFGAVYLSAVLWELLGRERLRIVDGFLEHRGAGTQRVPLADIDVVEVVPRHVLVRRRDGTTLRLLDEPLNQSDAAREWIAAWIREHARR